MTPPSSTSDPAEPNESASEARPTGRRRAVRKRAQAEASAPVAPHIAELPLAEASSELSKRALRRAAVSAAKAEGVDAKAARASVRATLKSAKSQTAVPEGPTAVALPEKGPVPLTEAAPEAAAAGPVLDPAPQRPALPDPDAELGAETAPVPATRPDPVAPEDAAEAPRFLPDPPGPLAAAAAPIPAAAAAVQAEAAPKAALVPTPAPGPHLAPNPPAPPAEAEDDEADDDRPGGRRARRRARASGRGSDPSNYVVAPTASAAQIRPRHYGVIVAFLLMVVLPTVSYSWYLWTRAVDQYESDVGFGSRTEEGPTTFDFVGALTGAGQSGSKDMDILNQFVVSQELVAKIDAELDLRALWSKPQADPLNAFRKGGTIEDLVAYWERMVLVDYDTGTGLMNLRVFAFEPADAQRIAVSILRESTAIINELSQTAQEDTTRYSRLMLDETEQKLAAARLAVLDFQVKNNIVDPSNVVSNQLSVVATLVQELANTQVELDMLQGTVPEGDPRLTNLTRRLEVIQNRIAAERAKVGAAASPDQPGYANLLAEFERLKVEQDFAQQAYLSALAAHDQAQADAQKKTRYLATYVAPTLAEASTAPNRPVHAALAALVGFLIWSVSVLTYYALRDRR